MNIPVNFATWGMAVLPIVVLVVLMTRFHWNATKAALVGLGIATFSALVFYKAEARMVAIEAAKGAWSALPILLVIATAILLYQVGRAASAFSVIKEGMSRLLPNELMLVLAIGWGFESFLQGITGFGVPVAVGAPLLIGIGVTPMYAILLSLLGPAWGNTFGTLALSWEALASSAGLASGSTEYYRAAFWASVFLLVWDLLIGMMICCLYGRGEAVRKGLPAVLAMAIVSGGGELVMSQLSPTLANFVPSAAGLIVLVLMGRMKMYREEWRVESSKIMVRQSNTSEDTKHPIDATEEEWPSDMTLLQAVLPYILLTIIALSILIVTPIHEFLGQFQISISVPETVTGYGYVNEASDAFSPITPFTHASMFLLISALAGLVYYQRLGRLPSGAAKNIGVQTISMMKAPGMAVLLLVIMSKIMSGTGQTVVLAQGIAGVLGNKYLILAPFVGMLGTFMTGSNMSSNILFGDFQMTTSSLLGVNAAAVLGAQTGGASVGAAISPSNIMLGSTTANCSGKEGEVLKIMLVIAMPVAIGIGVFLFLVFGL
jgi:lactate permease